MTLENIANDLIEIKKAIIDLTAAIQTPAPVTVDLSPVVTAVSGVQETVDAIAAALTPPTA